MQLLGIAGPKGSSENKEVGRVHVAIIAKKITSWSEEWILEKMTDSTINVSFAAFGLRLALEAMDNVDEKENIVDEKKINTGTKNKNIDISSLDSLSEEWEGKVIMATLIKKTVVQDISKIDLASLTDWDSNPIN